MLKRLTIIVLLVLPLHAAAASGGGVPVSAVVSQIVNISILIGLLYFTQRKMIAQYFKDKRQTYLDLVELSSKSKKEAEQTLAEISNRLEQMQTTYSAQLVEAEKNAQDSYRDQLANAKNEAERIKKMAMTTVDFEQQKMIETLRVETFALSAQKAKEELESKLTPEQKKAWTSHFVAANQGVH